MNGFVYLCEEHRRGFPAEEFVDTLGDAGLSLANAETHDSFVWTEEGERKAVRENYIANVLTQGGTLSFELWFDKDVSAGCSFRTISAASYVVAFDLWGLETHERNSLARLGVARFRAEAARDRALLLVVDRPGLTAEFDWDHFVLGRAQPPAWPEVIGLRQSAAEAFPPLLQYARQEIGEYALFFGPAAIDIIR